MKRLLIPLIALLASSVADAGDTTCRSQATEKNISGRELSDFLHKCQSEARAHCVAESAKRQFEPGMKAIFIRKCFNAAVGS